VAGISYGWNDIGYHQNQKSSANPSGADTTKDIVRTPHLDQLASEGVKLENYYVQPLCSPTRGTVLTGRYASHTGIGPNVIRPTSPYAMPKDEVMIPAVLKLAGYSTHMVGKWHQGYCDVRYTPTHRGFDSFLGYLNGAEDYFQHTRADAGFSGLDFRNGTTDVDLPEAVTSLSCNLTECYSAHVFAAEVVRIVENHDSTVPLFIYLPFQSVHDPQQAPQSYIDPYIGKFNNSMNRIVDAAMVSAMDEAVGNVTAAFKRKGLWDDTVLIFSTGEMRR
jgi:arylsulfatase B/arylsulfatase I/J